MSDIGFMVNDAAAPITSALNSARQAARARLAAVGTNVPQDGNGTLAYHEAAVNEIMNLLAAVIVAVHQLETGSLPEIEIASGDGA